MSQFHTEEKHDKHFAILFDSFNIKQTFISATQDQIKYLIVKDKEENRISAMLKSAGALGASLINLQQSAIACISVARSEEEAILKQYGLLKIEPQGIAICPTCLDKTILACEENLEVLKDLREAIKQYVP